VTEDSTKLQGRMPLYVGFGGAVGATLAALLVRVL
jgi:hypothetical protein